MTVPGPHLPNALDRLRSLAFHLDDVDVLRPGLDYRGGHMYVTLPMDRTETKTIGRGKTTREVEERITTTICVRSTGPRDPHPDVFPYDEDGVRAKGFRFPSTFTQSLENRWPIDSLEDYLGGTAATVDPTDLYNELRDVYRTFIEYPEDIHYDLVPLFVLGSYMFRLFPATGYIHFFGTRDSGKSQNMNLLSAFGLNTVWASNMTPSSLFRTIAGCPGVICVDEAETDHWKTEKGQELRQILLAGYADGSTVARTEKGPGDKFITVHYEAYSPKILSSIAPQDPTLTSRCIVIPMQRTLRPIPEFDPKKSEHVNLRGRIYTWAMQHHDQVRAIRDEWFDTRAQRAPDLRARAWQISQLYIILAQHVGGTAHAERIIDFLNEYFAKAAKSREDADLQLTLLKALPRVLATTSPHPDFFYSVKDIHNVISSYLDEDAKDYYKTRTVTRHLPTLGFPRIKAAKGGKHVQIHEDDVRKAFERHAVTPFPEDTEWRLGNQSYQSLHPVPEDHDGQQSLDYLDHYLESAS